MGKLYFVAVWLLLAFGAMFSLILIPSTAELALIYYKDKQYEKALTLYRQQWNEGNRTLFVVQPLSELYLLFGELDEAIGLIKGFLKDNPDSVTARRHLGTLYYQAQRPTDYLRNLEMLTQHDHSTKTLQELSDVYYFQEAFDNQIRVLEQLVTQKDSLQEHHLRLMYLYAHTKQYAKAANYLLDIYDRFAENISADMVAFTVSILSDLAPLDNTEEIQNTRNALRTALNTVLEEDYLPIVQKRLVAYRLLQHDYKKEAETLFMSLAQDAPADSPDVAQLLYIWGPRPPKEAIRWIADRISEADDTMQVVWLRTLLNAGLSKYVIALVERRLVPDSPVVQDVFAEALVAAGQRDKLTTHLNHSVKIATNTARLKRLATFAAREGLTESALIAHVKLLAQQPDNPEALRAVGIARYDSGQYTEAEKLLTRYLAVHQGDYRSHYYMGEILRRKKHPARAHYHYEEALRFLQQDKDHTIEKQLTHSFVLFRLDKVEDAVARMRILEKTYPENVDVRADFATLLMEAGRLDEAESVLATIKDK